MLVAVALLLLLLLVWFRSWMILLMNSKAAA
jgi:hypothetical protein